MDWIKAPGFILIQTLRGPMEKVPHLLRSILARIQFSICLKKPSVWDYGLQRIPVQYAVRINQPAPANLSSALSAKCRFRNAFVGNPLSAQGAARIHVSALV